MHPAPCTLHHAPCTLQEGALTRILTPTRRVDLLADVQRARDEKRWRAVLTSHMHHMHDVHDMHDTP